MSGRLGISGHTRLAAVLGWPASHSKSPALHNAAFAEAEVDAVYVAMGVAPEDLGNAVRGLRAIGLLGASVTVPHKQAVMRYCDSLSPAAQAIGAVNTLVFVDGEIIGHNTDARGFVAAFVEETGESFAGKRVALLGGGGAARAVAFGVREAGADPLCCIARTPSKVNWMPARSWSEEVLAEELGACDVLIDCTSMGMSLASEGAIPAPLPIERMHKGAIVSTLVYHRETALLSEAKRAGLKTVDGAGMLLHQGACAFELWTGKSAPLEAMRKAMQA